MPLNIMLKLCCVYIHVVRSVTNYFFFLLTHLCSGCLASLNKNPPIALFYFFKKIAVQGVYLLPTQFWEHIKSCHQYPRILMNPLWFENLRHMKLRYGFYKILIMKSFLQAFVRLWLVFTFSAIHGLKQTNRTANVNCLFGPNISSWRLSVF